MSEIHTPFTPEDVEALNKRQKDRRFHPYTCPYPHKPHSARELVATVNGWKCPTCDYTQGWAHQPPRNFDAKELAID